MINNHWFTTNLEWQQLLRSIKPFCVKLDPVWDTQPFAGLGACEAKQPVGGPKCNRLKLCYLMNPIIRLWGFNISSWGNFSHIRIIHNYIDLIFNISIAHIWKLLFQPEMSDLGRISNLCVTSQWFSVTTLCPWDPLKCSEVRSWVIQSLLHSLIFASRFEHGKTMEKDGSERRRLSGNLEICAKCDMKSKSSCFLLRDVTLKRALQNPNLPGSPTHKTIDSQLHSRLKGSRDQ